MQRGNGVEFGRICWFLKIAVENIPLRSTTFTAWPYGTIIQIVPAGGPSGGVVAGGCHPAIGAPTSTVDDTTSAMTSSYSQILAWR